MGGIYTVLRTKAGVSTDELGDQYIMMGPLVEDRVRLEVETLEPDTAPMHYAIQHMREQMGFRVCYFSIHNVS